VTGRGRSVLLVRFLAFGDVLLTLPVAEALAGSDQVAAVDMLVGTDYAEIARRSPAVRTVFGYDTATGRCDGPVQESGYDLIADLHTRGAALPTDAERLLAGLRATERTGYAAAIAPADGSHTLAPRGRDEHAVDYYARAVAGLLTRPPGPGHLALTDAERAAAAAVLPAGAVCLAPGARYPWKRWPAASYAALADELRAGGLAPVLVGHSFDRPYLAAVRALSPDTPQLVGDVVTVAAAMAVAGVVVANNSGLNALGAAAGARVVCVHSHTLPVMWRPWGEGHVDLTGTGADMPCSCTCPVPLDLATPCGKGIPVGAVAAAVRLARSRDVGVMERETA
jgi:ADP-heptose:LPS heptosyltransferase